MRGACRRALGGTSFARVRPHARDLGRILMADIRPLMTALFADHASAECAYASLAARGYTPADVRLHMTADTRDRLLAAAVQRRERDGAIAALVSALVGRRVPPERAALYEDAVRAGGIVMGLTPNSVRDAEQLQQEWRAAGASQIICPVLDGRNAA